MMLYEEDWVGDRMLHKGSVHFQKDLETGVQITIICPIDILNALNFYFFQIELNL